MSPQVDPQVANFNPTAFALENQQRQANLATTQQEQGLRAQDIALRQQQTQQAQLQNTLAQRQLQDQEIERQMFRDYYGAQSNNNAPAGTPPAPGAAPAATAPATNPLSDPQAYARYMASHGASGPAIMAGMSSIVTLGTNIAKMNSDQIDLEAKNLNRLKDDAVGYVAQPSEKAYTDLYKDVVLREPRMADELPAPGPGVAPGQQDIQHFLGKVGALGQLLANRKTETETEEASAKALQAKEETRKAKLTNDLLEASQKGTDPATLTGGQHPISAIGQGLPADDPTMRGLINMYDQGGKMPILENGLTRYPMREKAMEAMAAYVKSIGEANNPQIIAGKAKEAAARVAAENQPMIDRQVAVQHALETLTPDQQRLAEGIANYQVAPIGGFALSRPENRGVMAAAMALNPQYQETNYEAFRRTENDAATGNIAKQTTAAKTVLGHFSTLSQAADALKNNDIQLLNRLANAIGVQVGATPKTTYDTIVHRIGPEITKAYVASGGRADERGANEEDFASKLGPDQIKNNIGVSAHLLGTKMDKLQEQYNEGTFGRGKRQLVNPQDRATIQSLEGRANTPAIPKTTGGSKIPVAAPNGKTYYFDDQKTADAFKQSAGIR